MDKFTIILKERRKELGLSQEQLAEKLHVSRQAITKWESGRGWPDIENLRMVSKVLGISLDTMMEGGEGFPYESTTEYDIDRNKALDIHPGTVTEVVLKSHEKEKLMITLCSRHKETLERDVKVHLEDRKRAVEVRLNRKEEFTGIEAQNDLFVTVYLPRGMAEQVELDGCRQKTILQNLDCKRVELEGICPELEIINAEGHIEVNSSRELKVTGRNLKGRLDLNLISTKAELTLMDGGPWNFRKRGIANSLILLQDGNPAPGLHSSDSPYWIEINGLNSELRVHGPSTGSED